MSEPKTKAANLPTLPADLPENWVYAQTIAPNGTEAGLTPQHGYNYLMQQVNQAQSLLNQVTAILQEQEAEMATKDYVTEQANLKVSKAGDTMTGALVLPGNPTANLQAAPKQYVDTAVQPKANQADLNAHVNNKSNPHSVTAAQAGAVPTTRKVNNKALSGDISLTAADVGALGVNATAAAATKLATARTIRTNLASTSTASFNGTANITPGVTGVLPVANGGTGSSTEKYLKLAGGVMQGDIVTGHSIVTPGLYNGGAVFIGNNESSGMGKVSIKLGSETIDTAFPRPVILRGVATPTASTDAANKDYVDGSQRIFYGTCSTTGNTDTKFATVDGFPGLVTGVCVAIKFTHKNTYTVSGILLNVNRTGAKAIKTNGGTNYGGTWIDGGVVEFVYDGTYWVVVNGSIATADTWGITKLSTDMASTNTTTAASSYAVWNIYARIPEFKSYTGNGNSDVYISLYASSKLTPTGVLICDSRGYALGISNNGSTRSLPGGFVPYGGKLTNPNDSSVYIEFGRFTVNNVDYRDALHFSTANAANTNGVKYYCIVFYT